MPLGKTLVFPALFAAGMALVDTADRLLMVGAYGWAFVWPVRGLGLREAGWDAVARFNDDLAGAGYAAIGLFALCWAGSAAVRRWRGYDRLEAGAR